MEVHHLIGEHVEGIAKSKCLYCNAPFDTTNWESYHLDGMHYKTITCTCGKIMTMHVDFDGDGHDSWRTRNVLAESAETEKKPGIDDAVEKAEQEQDLLVLENEIRTMIEQNTERPFSVLAGKIIQDMKGKAESSRVLKIINKIKIEKPNK